MTKEEIKALVKAKIAGQGTMVDVGGALPKVLDGIVDIIPEASAGLGLSGVYSEGGNITIPEGTFAILAEGTYTINEEEEEVPSGNIGIYAYEVGLTLVPVGGGSGPQHWEAGGTVFMGDETPVCSIPGYPNVGDIVRFSYDEGTAEEPAGEEHEGAAVITGYDGGTFFFYFGAPAKLVAIITEE